MSGLRSNTIGRVCAVMGAQFALFACNGMNDGDGEGLQIRATSELGGRTHGRLLVSGDINGDGEQDFVVGVPDAGSCDEGEIQVWYNGYVEGVPEEVWHRDTAGIEGSAECNAAFGSAVMVGDFNADGYDDVAIGVPGADVSANNSAGNVQILYGTVLGLTDVGDQIFHQDTAGVSDSAEASDAYGTALASGDFDCDGYADLAIGAPGESIGTTSHAGAINILFGDRSGISGARDQFLHQDAANVEDAGEAGDHFGAFLAAGNIDRDNEGFDCDDLAVGVPDESLSDGMGQHHSSTGAVAVFYGGVSGLSPSTDELWHQGRTGIPGDNEADDQFGRGVYLDDRNADGFSDLVAIGHGDDLLYVILGTADGLTAANSFSVSPEEGKVKDACIWLCNLVWLALPPGPACDCSFCDLYIGTETETPCPHCA